jgi:TPR repeat protein
MSLSASVLAAVRDALGGVDEKMNPEKWRKVSLEELHRIAETGNLEAQFWLGTRTGGAEAVNWYRRAAEQGSAAAQYMLAACLMNDAQNYVETVSWFRKAAEQGDARAQVSLGGLLVQATGVEEDMSEEYVEAVSWFRKAAEQGLALGQLLLGRSLLSGLGVNQDMPQAALWIRKAAEQRVTEAEHTMGVIFHGGLGVGRDFSQAATWFRKGAEQGDPRSQARLGDQLRRGEGVKQDISQAAMWYREAAEHGDLDACERYGTMLMKGKGVTRDCDEARYWLGQCPESVRAVEKIEEINEEAGVIASRTLFADVVASIRAGSSVLGVTVVGNTPLHTSAIHLAVEPVALLLEHPRFDDIVVIPNDSGQLAREVVGESCSAADKNGSTARVIASALSCRRSTRAACLLWCVQEVCRSTRNHGVFLPREVGELIARFVVSPRGAIDLSSVVYASTLRAELAASRVSGNVAKRTAGEPEPDCQEPESKRARRDS